MLFALLLIACFSLTAVVKTEDQTARIHSQYVTHDAGVEEPMSDSASELANVASVTAALC